MPQITKTYNINSIQQLIDLNEDSKNFKLNFHCKSHGENDEYHILVLNQSQLDSQDANELPYKHVVREISGDVTADKSVYQNYFLCIKSDKQCMVDITINKEELPEISKEDFGEKVGERVPHNGDKAQKVGKNIKKKKSFLQSPLFLWIVIAIIACILLYFIFFTKSKSESSVHGGSVHKGSVHGGSVHGGSVHKGSVHGGSVHGGSVVSSVEGSVSSRKNKKGKKYSFNDFYM